MSDINKNSEYLPTVINNSAIPASANNSDQSSPQLISNFSTSPDLFPSEITINNNNNNNDNNTSNNSFIIGDTDDSLPKHRLRDKQTHSIRNDDLSSDDDSNASDDSDDEDSDCENRLHSRFKQNPLNNAGGLVFHSKNSDLDDKDMDELVDITSAPAAIGGEFDSEFMSLVRDFAQMDLPTYYSKEERCPLCEKIFSTPEFAEHVYKCIEKLDDVEKRELADMDYLLAIQLSMEEVEDFDLLDSLQRQTGATTKASDNDIHDIEKPKLAMLQDQDDMKRKYERFLANQALVYNRYRFAKSKIPIGECCVCGLKISRGELDNHVLACLNTSPELRLGPGRKQQQQVTTQMNEQADDQPTKTTTTTTTTSISTFRDVKDDEDDEISSSNTTTKNNTIGGDGDDDDDDDNQQNNNTNNKNSAVGVLNAHQVGLMARMMHDRTTAIQNNTSSTGEDLNGLLQAFKTFGLDKETLKRARDDVIQQQQQKQKQLDENK